MRAMDLFLRMVCCPPVRDHQKGSDDNTTHQDTANEIRVSNKNILRFGDPTSIKSSRPESRNLIGEGESQPPSVDDVRLTSGPNLVNGINSGRTPKLSLPEYVSSTQDRLVQFNFEQKLDTYRQRIG
jgi:hypothetical protein